MIKIIKKDGGEEFKSSCDLNRKLQQDLKDSKIELSEALTKIEELKKEIFHPVKTYKKDNSPAKNIDVANYYIKQNKELENQNKSLIEQNKELESKEIEEKEIDLINQDSNLNALQDEKEEKQYNHQEINLIRL